MKKFISIDIGGTMIKYGLLNPGGKVLETGKMKTEADQGGPGIVKKVYQIIETFLGDNPIEGVCISTAGMVDSVKGEIFFSGKQIPNYAGTKFKSLIEEKYQIPCEVENDVNCAGLAEAIDGAAKDADIVFCMTVGTGIGGCLVIERQIFHGFSNSACEVGYMNTMGSELQDLCSTTALVQRVSKLKEDDASDWDGYRIFENAKLGDLDCIKAIKEMCNALGMGLANICYVVNPEIIVLGGGIMEQKEYLEPLIKESLKKQLKENIFLKTKLTFAEYKNNAGMLGAFYNFKKKH